MKKGVKKRGDFDKPLAAGFLFAGLVLIVSLTGKFFNFLDGFVGIFMDLFSEFGYDLNIFGIIVGIISAFLTAFCLTYLYNLILNKFSSIGNK